jgi:hypothetical protein
LCFLVLGAWYLVIGLEGGGPSGSGISIDICPNQTILYKYTHTQTPLPLIQGTWATPASTRPTINNHESRTQTQTPLTPARPRWRLTAAPCGRAYYRDLVYIDTCYWYAGMASIPRWVAEPSLPRARSHSLWRRVGRPGAPKFVYGAVFDAHDVPSAPANHLVVMAKLTVVSKVPCGTALYYRGGA